jgi:hypothetical protein
MELAAQLQIKLEQRVMQQNQKDGTQPKTSKIVRRLLFRFLASNFQKKIACSREGVEPPGLQNGPQKKRRGKPGRSLVQKGGGY